MGALFPSIGNKISVPRRKYPPGWLLVVPWAVPRTEPSQGHSGTVEEGGDFGDRLTLWLLKAPEAGSGIPHSGKLSPEGKLTLPSLSLLPTGQLPTVSRSPRGAFSLGLFPGRHLPDQSRKPSPGSTQQNLGRLQLSDSKVLLGEKEADKSQGDFPEREKQSVTQGAAAESFPPPPPQGMFACICAWQCVFWWSPGISWDSRALQS